MMFVVALAFVLSNIVPVLVLIISLFFYNVLDDVFGAQSIHDTIGAPVMTMILRRFGCPGRTGTTGDEGSRDSALMY